MLGLLPWFREPVNALSEWLDASGDTQVDGIWDTWPRPLAAWEGTGCLAGCSMVNGDLEPYGPCGNEIMVIGKSMFGPPEVVHIDVIAQSPFGVAAMRSPSRVWTEIQYLRRHYSPDRIWFTTIFAIKPAWLSNYSPWGNNPIPFGCLSRADLLKDPSYAQDLQWLDVIRYG